MKLVAGSLGVVLLGATSASADEAWTRISTADGRGADTTIEVNRSIADYGDQPLLGLHQNMPDTGVGQKIYLRFDLTSLRNRRVEKAHLTLQPVSGYEARYDFNVFGLKETADGADTAWQESGSGEALTWANAPGHDAANPGGPFEVNQIQEFEEVEQTRPNGETRIVKQKAGVRREIVNNGGMDVDAVIYLGKISIRPGNNRTRLVSDSLAGLLNSDKNDLVTLVLTRATPAGRAITFASKEHALFDPPCLWVTTSERSGGIMEGVNELVSFPLPSDFGNETISQFINKIDFKALQQRSWIDFVEDSEILYKALDRLYGQDPASSTTRLVTSLAELLHIETAFKAAELLDDEWSEQIADVLTRHPDRADELLYSFFVLKGMRMTFEPESSQSFVDLRPLLDYDLPPLARQTVMEFAVDIYEQPGENDRLAHYRGLIPVAYGQPTTPHIISQYAKELQTAEGEDAVLTFLTQTAALKPDEPMGRAASVLRVSHESDPDRKASLVAEFVESGDGEVALALRPHYLTHEARNGQLVEALSVCYPGIHENRTSDPRNWGQAVVGQTYETLGGSTRVSLFPKAKAASLDLGEVASAAALTADLAKQLYEEGEHLEAASVALAWLEQEEETPPGLGLDTPISFDDILAEDTPGSRHAAAALLLHRVSQVNYETALSRKFLRDAASASATGRTQAYSLFFQALSEAQRGKPEKASSLLQEAEALAPDSTALAELRELLAAADGS